MCAVCCQQVIGYKLKCKSRKIYLQGVPKKQSIIELEYLKDCLTKLKILNLCIAVELNGSQFHLSILIRHEKFEGQIQGMEFEIFLFSNYFIQHLITTLRLNKKANKYHNFLNY